MQERFAGQCRRMIETSGVIEKEQGNGFYLVTLEQPAGHQCLCRAAGKLTKFRIKLLAGRRLSISGVSSSSFSSSPGLNTSFKKGLKQG